MKIITSMLPDQVIRSSRKTLSISINENAELIVRAPNRISDQKIQNFINEKENWITRNQSVVKARVEEAGKDKNMLLYLGTLFPLKTDNNAKKISFNGKEFLADLQNKEKTNKSLKTWYKNKFKEVAVPRLFYFAEKHNLQVNQVRIKEQRTLWGSCSSRNNINLNFLLIMAPLKVIDYVIIHELVHTIHKNHSANFWSAVEELCLTIKKLSIGLKKMATG